MVKKSIGIAICLAAWAVVAASVPATSAEARKLLEFGNVGWEDEMSHLDYLDSQLRASADSIAYILVYGGRLGDRRGETQARIACIRDYMVNRRGVNTERLIVTKGGYREESTVELWLATRADRAPVATPTVGPQDVRLRKGKAKDWKCRCNI